MARVLSFDELDEGALERLLREERVSSGRGRWLRCTACKRRVTSAGARMSLQGGHEHSFTNPHGIIFRIGLFQEAVGCSLHGAATETWTWFRGYAWQIGVCRSCRIHLGWGFRAIPGTTDGSPAYFYGLILDRLLEG